MNSALLAFPKRNLPDYPVLDVNGTRITGASGKDYPSQYHTMAREGSRKQGCVSI